MTNPTPTSAAAMTIYQLAELSKHLQLAAANYSDRLYRGDPFSDVIEYVSNLLAQAAPVAAQELEFDRDTDGELLIDWSPSQGRAILLSLRDDGRLSYAVMWDGEKFHGKAQMPRVSSAAKEKL